MHGVQNPAHINHAAGRVVEKSIVLACSLHSHHGQRLSGTGSEQGSPHPKQASPVVPEGCLGCVLFGLLRNEETGRKRLL